MPAGVVREWTSVTWARNGTRAQRGSSTRSQVRVQRSRSRPSDRRRAGRCPTSTGPSGRRRASVTGNGAIVRGGLGDERLGERVVDDVVDQRDVAPDAPAHHRVPPPPDLVERGRAHRSGHEQHDRPPQHASHHGARSVDPVATEWRRRRWSMMSSSTPPLDSITVAEPTLSSSHVRSARSTPPAAGDDQALAQDLGGVPPAPVRGAHAVPDVASRSPQAVVERETDRRAPDDLARRRSASEPRATRPSRAAGCGRAVGPRPLHELGQRLAGRRKANTKSSAASSSWAAITSASSSRRGRRSRRFTAPSWSSRPGVKASVNPSRDRLRADAPAGQRGRAPATSHPLACAATIRSRTRAPCTPRSRKRSIVVAPPSQAIAPLAHAANRSRPAHLRSRRCSRVAPLTS